ncbi:MAG: cache domain-containing protein [Thermodesulfobacteriota bacterium]
MSAKKIFHSTTFKLITSFLGATLLQSILFLSLGANLLNQVMRAETENRIRMDLNAAREIYSANIAAVRGSLFYTALAPDFASMVEDRNGQELSDILSMVARSAGLDFIGIQTADGKVLNAKMGGDFRPEESENSIAEQVFGRMVPVAGTVLADRAFLSAQDPGLAERARIKILPDYEKAAEEKNILSAGLVIAAGVPVLREGRVIAVLYGGMLVNRGITIVDTVKDTVFQNETYKGSSVGTATIFLNDVRVSTNVMTAEAVRAVGTRVSPEVRDRVLSKGGRWIGEAFVVNDWYITAYEPIEDLDGKKVGMLYVGVLEQKYNDIRRKILSIFVLITLAGMALAVGLGIILSRRILSPIVRLIRASRQVSDGSLTPDIGPLAGDEIGVLQSTFMDMVREMGRRRSESETRLLQSEKQASVGRLAAGVAHEINNPLTGVLTYTHMLLRRKDLSDDMRSDLQVVAESTERVRKIVKGLLDFSRQTRLDPEPTEINRVVASTIQLVENQALLKGIAIRFHPGENLPVLILDRSQIRSVFLNIIINAIDATDPGGSITIYTASALSVSESEQTGVEITIADTGCGIPAEHLDKIFDPFFTTKEVGQGTGLGLAVSYGIVKRHGGTIRVQSEKGRGTRFFVWLPVKEGTAFAVGAEE